MKFSFLFLWVPVFVVGLTACNSSTSSDATQAESSEYGPQTPTPEEAQRIQNRVAGDLLGDAGMFPFVYQGEGKSNWFEAYTMRFSLAYEDPLVPMTNAEIPWINPEQYNENNGIFLTYVRNGRPISLSSPYIMAQYINKSLPFCSSLDSIYVWMDDVQLQADDAEVLQKPYDVATASGKTAVCKDYYSGHRPERTPKWMSYAYIDYNDEYVIGMALTTTEETDYDLNRPLFLKLVKSFQQM